MGCIVAMYIVVFVRGVWFGLITKWMINTVDLQGPELFSLLQSHIHLFFFYELDKFNVQQIIDKNPPLLFYERCERCNHLL